MHFVLKCAVFVSRSKTDHMYTMQNSLHRGITPTVTKVVAKKLRLEGTEQLSAVGLENFFVASSRGTEQLLRQELQAFRIGKSLTLEEGGVRVDGSSGDLCKTVLLRQVNEHRALHSFC